MFNSELLVYQVGFSIRFAPIMGQFHMFPFRHGRAHLSPRMNIEEMLPMAVGGPESHDLLRAEA